MMKKRVLSLLFSLLCGCVFVMAQGEQKSSLQQKAESEMANKKIGAARYLYLKAYEDYVNKGQLKKGVECAASAASLYYRENLYKEAFDMLRGVDQYIIDKVSGASVRAALHYLTTKERMQMYIKLRRPASAMDQLKIMENFANTSGDDKVKNDLLYNKAIYYYTFGQTAMGNAVFQEMARKLTATKDYDKVDKVYKTLIESGRKSGSANMVAQSYSSYLVWKDSVNAMKHADEIGALKQQIADNEASIAEKDSSLTTRQAIIIGLAILAVALAVALALGAVVLMRYIVQNRTLKKHLTLSNESNALKAKFISNISAQIEPTLKKLNSQQPEVKALLSFTNHIQTLSELENMPEETLETVDTQIPSFCESLVEQIKPKLKKGVNLTFDSPKMSAKINREYVSHILLHLLENAAEYTPEGGLIKLEFKKRGAHKSQFLVSDTGQGIDESRRADVFKPFLEVRDLTAGDGLGLPICKQMALKVKGDLDLDPTYTKGTRFVLDLQV